MASVDSLYSVTTEALFIVKILCLQLALLVFAELPRDRHFCHLLLMVVDDRHQDD
jgi:hypothetical protein